MVLALALVVVESQGQGVVLEHTPIVVIDPVRVQDLGLARVVEGQGQGVVLGLEKRGEPEVGLGHRKRENQRQEVGVVLELELVVVENQRQEVEVMHRKRGEPEVRVVHRKKERRLELGVMLRKRERRLEVGVVRTRNVEVLAQV